MNGEKKCKTTVTNATVVGCQIRMEETEELETIMFDKDSNNLQLFQPCIIKDGMNEVDFICNGFLMYAPRPPFHLPLFSPLLFTCPLDSIGHTRKGRQ